MEGFTACAWAVDIEAIVRSVQRVFVAFSIASQDARKEHPFSRVLLSRVKL